MNIFIYKNLTLICAIATVTINIIIVASQRVSVIAQWIEHTSLVHEVVSSPLDGGRKFFGVLEHVSRKTCVVISTQVFVLHQHKFVSFIYDKSVVFCRTQTCVWPTQLFSECTHIGVHMNKKLCKAFQHRTTE